MAPWSLHQATVAGSVQLCLLGFGEPGSLGLGEADQPSPPGCGSPETESHPGEAARESGDPPPVSEEGSRTAGEADSGFGLQSPWGISSKCRL